VGIKITVLRDVAPCSSVEWLLHVSKQSSIFIFVFVISIYGDISIFSLHNVFFLFYYSRLLYLPGNCYQRKMGAQDLSKDVLEQLECPVCMQYMLPPIALCSNGHNICSSCKPKIQNCPTCREPLSDTPRRHWKNWLYDLSVLAPVNHTDAHSLFRSPSYVSMTIYASLVHSVAL